MLRKPCSAAVPLLALLALLVVALAGCGAGVRLSSSGGDRAPAVAGAAGNAVTRSSGPAAPGEGWSVVPLIPFADAWPSAAPRWKDIGDYLFTDAFRSTFSSSSSGAIWVAYMPDAPNGALDTRVYATGLKPNFCYQIKLVGKPGAAGGGLWGTDAHMAANTNIVKAGRYWDYYTETPHFNTTDRALVVQDPYYQEGWVAGYVLIGCFVTDVNGNTNGWVNLDGAESDNSYHVVWKSGQSIPANSAGPYSHPISRTGSATGAYPAKPRPASVNMSLYLEREPGVGQPYVLPNGVYDAVFMLTEESFHSSGTGGYWLTARVSDWSLVSSPVSKVPWVGAPGTQVRFGVPSLPRTASKLAFVTQPGNAVAGAVMSPVQVAIQDANGFTVPVSGQVTIALDPSSGELSGTTTVTAINGVATFDNLSVAMSGTYTLVASAEGLLPATSNQFTVVMPTQLAFTVQPSNAVAGVTMNPVQVAIQDATGSTVPVSATVSVALDPSSGGLTGTTSVTAVNGVATFGDLKVSQPGSYRLIAASGNLAGATSNWFTVSEPPSIDTVTIVSAVYSKPKLRVEAISSAGSTPKLTATAGGVTAVMSWDGGLQRYVCQFAVNPKPATVTVTSSLGGSATATVQ